MFEKIYYIYIITNKTNKVLYIGVTNNLARRIYEHKSKLVPGFSSKYNINKLVYFENTSNVYDALNREKQLKRWRRSKKIWLIETINPKYTDLANNLNN